MPDTSSRLALPLLAAGQAQKELFHNEALAILDALVLPVFAPEQDAPPDPVAAGACGIVGAAPSGAWTGQAGALAFATAGGWRFVAPRAGMQVLLADGRTARWDGTVWTLGTLTADRVTIGGEQVLGSRAAAIPNPAGGTKIDTEARAAIAALLAVLRNHGLIAT